MELELTPLPPLSVRLWYDDGTFRARDAYHILGNKRTTVVASRCGRAIGILYKVGKKVVVVKWRMKVSHPRNKVLDIVNSPSKIS